MQDLTGRIAVVTGAAGGIGRALAAAFLAEGAQVVLADRDEAALRSLAASLPGDPLTVVVDVTDRDQVQRLHDQAVDRHGAVDVLCNNAGIGGRLGPSWELPAREWDQVLDVNLRGVVNGIQAFVPGMVERGRGHVVNTASMAGLLPMPFGAPYVASKHAVVGLTANLRWELGQLAPGVSASVLCPGWVRTGVATSDHAGVLEGYEDGPAGQMAQRLADNVESGMEPADVAARVVHAVCDDEFWILTHPDQAAHVLPHLAGAVRSAGVTPSLG